MRRLVSDVKIGKIAEFSDYGLFRCGQERKMAWKKREKNSSGKNLTARLRSILSRGGWTADFGNKRSI